MKPAPAAERTTRLRIAFPMEIMSCIAFLPGSIDGAIALEMIERLCTTIRVRTAVSEVRVIAIIHMPIKPTRPAKPRSRTDKDAAVEPVRTVVAIRRTVVRGIVVVPVWTRGRNPDIKRNLRRSQRRTSCQQRPNHRCLGKDFQMSHTILLIALVRARTR